MSVFSLRFFIYCAVDEYFLFIHHLELSCLAAAVKLLILEITASRISILTTNLTVPA